MVTAATAMDWNTSEFEVEPPYSEPIRTLEEAFTEAEPHFKYKTRPVNRLIHSERFNLAVNVLMRHTDVLPTDNLETAYYNSICIIRQTNKEQPYTVITQSRSYRIKVFKS